MHRSPWFVKAGRAQVWLSSPSNLSPMDARAYAIDILKAACEADGKDSTWAEELVEKLAADFVAGAEGGHA